MKIKLSNRALKGYIKLPKVIKTKAEKKFLLLDQNFQHPSLRTKKMSGDNKYESRIDYHYRFTFIIDVNTRTLYILTIGMHDEGLGKQ